MTAAAKDTKRFGLVGKRLDYSFSKSYFEKQYHNIYTSPALYDNYELPEAGMILQLVEEQHLDGLNITIPYKETIIPFLDRLSDEATAIGAVNTLKIKHIGKHIFIEGHNTDVLGFESCVKDTIDGHSKALVLGTGGAAKAVAYVLRKHGLEITFVSRKKQGGHIINYDQLSDSTARKHTLIVNATPIGTLGCDDELEIPYNAITPNHFCIDLVYNPSETQFMKECHNRGATVKNGLEMLHRQAEESWKIWNT